MCHNNMVKFIIPTKNHFVCSVHEQLSHGNMEKKVKKRVHKYMSTSKHVQTILNGTIYALKTILPMNINIASPSITTEPYTQMEMGVLIGLVGDLKGRVIIDGSPSTFGNIGSSMFGMPLEGEMLESFTGEFGNMIAGNLCTHAGQNQLELDITPPTVMVGNTKLYGFQQAFSLPATIHEVGNITILFTIDEED